MCDIKKQPLVLLNFDDDEVMNMDDFSLEKLKTLTYKQIIFFAKINKIETHYMLKRNGKYVSVLKNINMLFLDLIQVIKKYCNNDDIENFEKSILKNQEQLIKNIRMEAFNILSNKKEISKKLIKTKICNSIMQNIKCKHGDNCRFAHDKKEIVSCNCLFGENCIYVYKKDDIYLNKLKTKICEHRHPLESKKNYIARIC